MWGSDDEKDGGIMSTLMGVVGIAMATAAIVAGLNMMMDFMSSQGAEVSNADLGELAPSSTPDMSQSQGIGRG
jgi:hypothetical protein